MKHYGNDEQLLFFLSFLLCFIAVIPLSLKAGDIIIFFLTHAISVCLFFSIMYRSIEKEKRAKERRAKEWAKYSASLNGKKANVSSMGLEDNTKSGRGR